MESKNWTMLPVAAAAGLIVAGLAVPSTWAQDVALGADFRVNTFTTGGQSEPRIANSGDGFVIVWTSFGQDGDGNGGFGRRFGADGAALGPEFQVASDTSGRQTPSDVSFGQDGSFIVSWRSALAPGDDDDDFRARRFDPSGAPLGSDFVVPFQPDSDQFDGQVAISNSGRFFAAWTGENADFSNFGVRGRLFEADGTPLPGVFAINESTTGAQRVIDVAVTPGGQVLVMWSSNHTGSYFLYGRRYTLQGSSIGGEFQISDSPTSIVNAGLAMADSGEFAAAWGFAGGAFLRRFDADGTAKGPSVEVDQGPLPAVETVAAAGDAEGNVVVVWGGEFDADGDERGIVGRRYDATGSAVGDAFVVNSYTTGRQWTPRVASDRFGNFVVTWSGSIGGPVLRPVARRFATNRLGDRVFHDVDGDGIQGPAEPGVPFITVRLLDGDANVLRTVQTGPDGSYSFGVLPPATDLTIRFEPSSDWRLTVADAGADDTLDSDADPLTGETPVVQVAAGEARTDIDAGLIPVGAIFLDSFETGDTSAWSVSESTLP